MGRGGVATPGRTTTRNSLQHPWWQLELRPQLAFDPAFWIALLVQVALPLPLASVFLIDTACVLTFSHL